MENNTILNKYHKNKLYVLHTHNCQPTLPHPVLYFCLYISFTWTNLFIFLIHNFYREAPTVEVDLCRKIRKAWICTVLTEGGFMAPWLSTSYSFLHLWGSGFREILPMHSSIRHMGNHTIGIDTWSLFLAIATHLDFTSSEKLVE